MSKARFFNYKLSISRILYHVLRCLIRYRPYNIHTSNANTEKFSVLWTQYLDIVDSNTINQGLFFKILYLGLTYKVKYRKFATSGKSLFYCTPCRKEEM